MFWLDNDLGADVMLDGIVAVVDAKYATKACAMHCAQPAH